MAEDQEIKEPEVKVPLRGPEAAKTTLERLQKKGILPVKEKTDPTKIHTAPFVTEAPPPETYDPARKIFPQEPEVKAKIVESYAGEETIPADIKKELTEEARKLNTMAMGTGESSETEQARVTPFSEKATGQALPATEAPQAPEPGHLEAKGGSAFLKKALEANKPPEPTVGLGSSVYKIPKGGEYLPPSQRTLEKRPPVNPVPISSRRPMPEESLRAEYTKTAPEQPKGSFFGNLLNRIRGRA